MAARLYVIWMQEKEKPVTRKRLTTVDGVEASWSPHRHEASPCPMGQVKKTHIRPPSGDVEYETGYSPFQET